MPHFLDVGFHWTDLTADGSPPGTPRDAGTLCYGFQLESGDPGGQKQLRARLNDVLQLRVFELTRIEDVGLVKVQVEAVKVAEGVHGEDEPAASGSSPGGNPGHGGSLPGLHGTHKPDRREGEPGSGSVGLNAQGTKWELRPVTLDEAGVFLVTVRVQAEVDKEPRHWMVDPKIIVGRD